MTPEVFNALCEQGYTESLFFKKFWRTLILR